MNIREKITAYAKYNLVEKWQFTFLEIPLTGDIFFMPEPSESLTIRLATYGDLPNIKNDIYPYLTSEEIRHDGQYFERIGDDDDDFVCFIAIVNEKIVHYFLIYKNAAKSPLVKIPFNKSLLKQGESYIGTAFTIPDARGMWIMPLSLSRALIYLRDAVKSDKAYVIVHKDTSGAEDFYKKLGFTVVDNAYKNNFYGSLIRIFTSN